MDNVKTHKCFPTIVHEFKLDLNKANYFAGHSLGEYTALASADVLSFSQSLKILKTRGNAMQSAVPIGEGAMVAVLGSDIEKIEKIIEENKDKYECFIANDNSNGQLVVSGNINEIDKFVLDLKSNSIKNIKLPVSGPFHCKLMKKATDIMTKEITKLEFKDPKNILISNVTGKEVTSSSLLKDLLIKQIENSFLDLLTCGDRKL